MAHWSHSRRSPSYYENQVFPLRSGPVCGRFLVWEERYSQCFAPSWSRFIAVILSVSCSVVPLCGDRPTCRARRGRFVVRGRAHEC